VNALVLVFFEVDFHSFGSVAEPFVIVSFLGRSVLRGIDLLREFDSLLELIEDGEVDRECGQINS
jgi:hypothetical protein